MTTGTTNWIISTNRLAKSTDLKDRFQVPLRQADRDRMSKVYPTDGVFNVKLGLSGAVDAFGITGTSEATDGDGDILALSLATDDGSNVPFENIVATPYYVALRHIEREIGIQVNPKNGDPEYEETLEDVGELGAPDSVTDLGGTIQFNINSLTESGVDHSGRTVVVWKVIPDANATTEAVAIESRTSVFSTPNNTITTTGTLGQGTVSTTAADYLCAVLGPTVRKNTDLRTVSGITFIGILTGGGAGNPPTGIDIADQNLIDVSLSEINNIADNLVAVGSMANNSGGARKPMLGVANGHAAVYYPPDGLIYVFAGHQTNVSDTNYLDTNSAYDPVADTWTVKTAIPLQAPIGGGGTQNAGEGAAAVVLGTTIYLIAGYNELASTNTVLVQRYRPATNTWDGPAADHPAPGGSPAYLSAGVIDGKIYTAGGNIGGPHGSASGRTHEYDPVGDSWTEKATMPSGLGQFSGSYHAVVDSKLYLFGGDSGSGGGVINDAAVYDPAVNTWTDLADIPDHPAKTGSSAWGRGSAVVVNGVIHGFGGMAASGPADGEGPFIVPMVHWMYNTVTDTFHWMPDAPAVSTAKHTAVADGSGIVHIMGGIPRDSLRAAFPALDNNFSYDAGQIRRSTSPGIASTTGTVKERLDAGGAWSVNTSRGDAMQLMPEKRQSGASCAFKDYIVYAGGFDTAGTRSQRVFAYYPASNTWTEFALCPTALEDAVLLADEPNNYIYCVLGGASGGPTGDIIRYDTIANTWTVVATLAVVRANHAAVLHAGSIYIAGGETVSTPITTLQRVDIGSFSVTTLAVMPSPREAGGMVVKRGVNDFGEYTGADFLLYLMGRSNGTIESNILKYDITDDTWLTIAAPASGGAFTARYRFAVTLVDLVEESPYRATRSRGQYVIVAGGDENTGTEYDLVDEWNLQTDTRTALPVLGSVMQSPELVAHKGRVFRLGGTPDGTSAAAVQTIEVFDKYAGLAPGAGKVTNFSASFFHGDSVVPDNTMDYIAIARDTIGFKKDEIWGQGNWETLYQNDIVRVGES